MGFKYIVQIKWSDENDNETWVTEKIFMSMLEAIWHLNKLRRLYPDEEYRMIKEV